jgi:hypothetical protein|tara:strand:+ start:626 stop:787 length:162 start_codon:yes stop_codon:yes gene_type:complete
MRRSGLYKGGLPKPELPKEEVKEVTPKFDNSRSKVLRDVYKGKIRNIRSQGER